MDKFKVLHVVGNLKIGGAENVAMNLYRYINRELFEFHYLVYGDEIGEYENEVKNLGGKVIHMDKPSRNYINFTKKLVKIMKNNGPYDIVHSHTLFNSGFVLEAAKRAGIMRRIAHSHTTKNKVYTNIIIQIYESYMRNKIQKNTTDYIACSKEAGEFLFNKETFNNKGIIIRNGINIKEFIFDEKIRNKKRQEFNIADKFVVGHVGHLSTVKNQLFLIDIFKCLTNRRNDLMLLLVGEGKDRSIIEEKIKENNLESFVVLSGNRDDVNEILQAMDVFVFPSLYEGLGLAVIEAQASGLPCIVSDKVPKEAFLTDLIQGVSLDNPVGYWADIIENSFNHNRNYSYKIIKNSGYDVEDVGIFLELFYINGGTK